MPGEWWLYEQRPIGMDDAPRSPIMGAADIMQAAFFGSDVYVVATPEKFCTLKPI